MSELSKQSPSPYAYLVAGGGGGMRSTIILRMIAQELAGRGIPYAAIDGITGEGDEQMVKYPSLQVEDMAGRIAEHPEGTPLLFISHCIGTVAALNTVERLEGLHPTSLVSIAPPLPSPYNTISTPQSTKKRTENNTLMRVVDLPEGAVDYSVVTESVARIDPQYFADMRKADDLEVRLRGHVEAGNAAVFAPEHDWNVDSPERVRAWHNEWNATLPADIAGALQARAPIVYDAAHGLYVSPRSGREVTTEQDVKFQMSNVTDVVDMGLEMLEYAGGSN